MRRPGRMNRPPHSAVTTSTLLFVGLSGAPGFSGLSAQDTPAEARTPWPALADSVVGEFRHAWGGFLRYARGHDELRPLSEGYRDWYEGGPFQMTPVDAWDTMLLMGLDAEAAEAKSLVLENLDFDRDVSVQVFEVTIRLLGGLLSAYQMDGDPRLLELATDLGTRLLPAFDSPTGMPYRFVNLRTGETSDSVSNPAEVGTL
ncbi:MAG TPA: glycoside hydrolase family 47 protein, partial [Longimicrobiales bacterium]|nr:glycoside hydrolase family 47 protein [Longimicrobiales bacterium]